MVDRDSGLGNNVHSLHRCHCPDSDPACSIHLAPLPKLFHAQRKARVSQVRGAVRGPQAGNREGCLAPTGLFPLQKVPARNINHGVQARADLPALLDGSTGDLSIDHREPKRVCVAWVEANRKFQRVDLAECAVHDYHV